MRLSNWEIWLSKTTASSPTLLSAQMCRCTHYNHCKCNLRREESNLGYAKEETNSLWVLSGHLSEFNCHLLPLHLCDNLSIAVVISISTELVNESKGVCTVDTIQSVHQAGSATLQKA